VKLAWGYFHLWYQDWSETGDEDLHRSYKLAKEALADPKATPFTQRLGHFLLAFLETYFKRDVQKALAEAKVAHALAPYDVELLAFLPEVLVCAGWHDPTALDETIAWTQEAFRRDPSGEHSWAHGYTGWAYYYKGQYEQALEHAMLVREPWVFDYALRALGHAAAGRTDEARAAVAKAVELEPSFSLTYYRKWTCYPNSPATESEVAGLRKLGLPEF